MNKKLPIPEMTAYCLYRWFFSVVFLFLCLSPLKAQDTEESASVTITGTVTDEAGEPLIGVSVAVEKTSSGTITDSSGSFSITVPNGSSLVFSYIGFESQSVPIGDQTEINIMMRETVEALDEVVVIGYGTQRRSDLTGAVSQVSAREINAFPTTNVLQSLSGRAAGVQVSPTTGAPGAGLNVRIRGTNSIQGSNEPLYVVDGFPIFGNNPTVLNNSDIESMEILKDASATAIYGSRGANGVVIITTRKGREGETRVDLDFSYGKQNLRKSLDLMNAQEFARFYNLQASNDGIGSYFTDSEISGLGNGFDWQDFVFQEAFMQTSTVNVNGGNEKTQFSLSGSYLGQEGIVKGSDYSRYALRTNVDHEISDKFSVNLSSTYTHLNTARRDSDGGARGNSMIGAAISAPPSLTPFVEDGSYRVLANAYPFLAPDIINPINFINEQSHIIKANVFLTNAALIYQPLPELTVKVSGGIENRDDRTDIYTSTNFINSNGQASVSTSQFRSLLNENTVTHQKEFNETHHLTVLAGLTLQNFRNTVLASSGSGFLPHISEYHDLGPAENHRPPSPGYAEPVFVS